MSIFTPAQNQSAYAKIGIMGFQGSGKTYTAVEFMIGLSKLCSARCPVYFIDSETGSDWAIPRFQNEGIELRVAKTRAFADLLSGIEEAERNGFGLIIDSVTHYWQEMVQAYKEKHNIGSRMAFHHWAVLKPEWQKFSNAFVNSRIHIVVCGRAGWEWIHEEDDEGHKELMKGGTKMKVEAEFGYEPALLIEMERMKDTKIGDAITHRGHILKDRRMDDKTLDGQSFDNISFENIMPHIECLNIGGDHLGVDTSRNSGDLFQPQGESYHTRHKRATICLEEINGELEARYPGTTQKSKEARGAIKKHYLGTYSETALADMKPAELEEGLSRIRDLFLIDDYEATVNRIVEDLKAAAKGGDK